MSEGQPTQGKATEQESGAETQEAEATMLQASPCQEQEVEVQEQTTQGEPLLPLWQRRALGKRVPTPDRGATGATARGAGGK
jgi:hypothetical protein